MGIRAVIRRILGQEEERKYADPRQEIARIEAARDGFGVYDGPVRGDHIIVSLTSFPARFGMLHHVVGSILCQTMRPDEIILYLDDDVDVESLPEQLLEMRGYGLQIETRALDLKPHKKYYYAIKEHPEATIITVDDDLTYPANLIEELWKMHESFPNAVVASRAHRILFDRDGRMMSYRQWGWEDGAVGEPSLALCATGTGGVLYPPHLMHADLLDYGLLHELSPRNDDLWLKVMQVLVGTRTVLCNQSVRKGRAILEGSQRETLNSINVHEDVNDIFLRNLCYHYGLTQAHFLD